MNQPAKRVLRPLVYDAIKRGAAKHGGVGRGTMYRRAGCPVCGIGLAHAEGALPNLPAVTYETWERVDDELYNREVARALGFNFGDSDCAVDSILGYPSRSDDRVPFEQWAEAMGAVRGVELPAEVYDALKASAEKYGGIGYQYLRSGDSRRSPCCILGHAVYTQPRRDDTLGSPQYGVYETALIDAFGTFWLYVGTTSDRAVGAINHRKGNPFNTRVTFDEWADELNVIRAAE